KHPDAALGGRKDFRPGLELKTDGGYVVAAPSRHKSGKAYRWLISPEDAPLAEMPEWLRKAGEEAKAASTAKEKNIHTTVGDLPPDWSERVERDDVLARYWTQPLLHYPTLSEAALAIANRLCAKYRSATHEQPLAVLVE